jgi:hypothetical protein
MDRTVNTTGAEVPFASRRREPRIDVRHYLNARSLGPAGPVVLAVRDLGYRGFAIESAAAVVPRTRCRFAFANGGDVLFTAEAVAVHCYLQYGAKDRWISGWEFPEQDGLDERIEAVIDEAAGTLQIE